MQLAISKRTFLRILLGSGICALARPHRVFAEAGTREGRDALAKAWADLVPHRQSARIVGLEYLRAYPAEHDVERLVSHFIADDSGNSDRPASVPKAIRPAALARRCREDFERGRVVSVQGWILSRTEARLCALIALP